MAKPSTAGDEIFDFPCDFPIKVFGSHAQDFPEWVTTLINRHVPDDDMQNPTTRSSSNGRYLAVTVSIRARSRAQLDSIYRELTADQRVVMAL